MNCKLVLMCLSVSVIAIGAGQKAFAGIPNPTVHVEAGQDPDYGINDTEGANPYTVITSQNAFRLVPMPPPPPPPTNDPMATATLKLTGLTRVSGQRPRALFVIVPKDPKNVKETLYFNLSEGDREGSLELVRINEDQEAAEVVHGGDRKTILLKDSKPPVVASAAPPVAPPLAKPVAAVNPAPQPQPQPGRGVMVAGGSIPTPPPTTAQEGQLNGTIPTRSMRATPNEQASGPRTLEESHIMMAVDAVNHNQEIVAGRYPPPPPPVQGMINPPDMGEGGEPSPQMPGIPNLPTPRPRTRR